MKRLQRAILFFSVVSYSFEVEAFKPFEYLMGAEENKVSQVSYQQILNNADIKGDTPLIHAVKSGNIDSAKILIKSGADVNIANNDGMTPLHIAAKKGDIDFTKLLVKSGAKNNLVDKYGMKAIDYAIENNLVEVALAIDAAAVTIETSQAGLPFVVAAAAGGGGISTSTMVLAGAGVASAGVGVAAASGGGGGGSTDSSGGGNNPPPPAGTNPPPDDDSRDDGDSPPSSGNNPPPPPAPLPQSSQPAKQKITTNLRDVTDFRSHQYALNLINAVNTGKSGTGVRVAVIDTGVFFDHPDLKVDRNISRNFYEDGRLDAEPNTNSVPYPVLANHGTWVTGIIAAQKNDIGIDGIAPDATIVALRAASERGQLPNQSVIGAMNYATDPAGGNVAIINNSWGSNSVLVKDEIDAYKLAVQRKVITVFATGNDFSFQPSSQSLLPETNPELQAFWLAVTAIDKNKEIADFSNYCGRAKAWCLAAPGVDIATTSDPDVSLVYNDRGVGEDKITEIIYPLGYIDVPISGTSFAAPHVSGALALLLEDPAIKADPAKAVEIILRTADKEFPNYKSDEYGQGILDVAKALDPVGRTTAATDDNIKAGNNISASTTRLGLGTASGDALTSRGLSYGILDEYGRFYQVALSTQVKPISLAERLYDFGDDIWNDPMKINDNVSFYLSSINKQDDSELSINDLNYFDHVAGQNGDIDQYDDTHFALMMDNGDYRHDLYYNMPLDEVFGFGIMNEEVNSNKSATGFMNPFLGFAKQAVAIVHEDKDSHDLIPTVRVAGFFGSSDNNIVNVVDDANAPQDQVSGFVAEINDRKDKLATSLQFGLMAEENRFLGSDNGGAFAVEKATPTWFSAMAAKYSLSGDVDISVIYNVGLSQPVADQALLIQDFSNIVSDSFAFGISSDNLVSENDRAGFIISQPLRVVAGSIDVRFATGTNIDGDISYVAENIDTIPSGREIDSEFYYNFVIKEDYSVKTSAAYIKEPGHIKNAEDEGVFMLNTSLKF